ncbi:hypothetical protein BPAE_0126g00030 [Botrytis paeoniae]|uniref:Uncharacterized protein n=1 Tax=Botrytis paeoniae TaxID=278948 RepID=A0A4Z1FJE4_9HELO|nr:hypothetical protein BPAE_0126g00030 [Botrytis paeoniae]
MNTSITCFIIQQREFPTVCPGPSPWTTSISLTTVNNTTTLEYTGYAINELSLNVCVPGNKFAFPWSVNRTLQTIEEELYLEIGGTMKDVGYEPTGIGSLRNYTQKCNADTTFGYFNLPTYANNSAGPLLPADFPISGAIASPHLTSALALFPDWSGLTHLIPVDAQPTQIILRIVFESLNFSLLKLPGKS